MQNEKALRRKKRQTKEKLKRVNERIIKKFKLEQFFGKKKMDIIPYRDPTETQHKRVVRQRLTSRRVNVDEYKQAVERKQAKAVNA